MRERASAGILLAGGLLLAADAVLTWLLPPSGSSGIRFWGGNALRYLPAWAAVAAYALAAAGVAFAASANPFDPRLASGEPDGTGAASGAAPVVSGLQSAGGRSGREAWIALAAVILAAAVFFLLRSRYALLGDNMLRVKEAEQGIANPNEIGVMSLYHGLVRFARRLAGARQVFAAVSIAAGVVYAAVAWALARHLDKASAALPAAGSARPRAGVLVVFAGLITAGSVELFCGYLEVYPLVLAWCLLTVWAAILAAENAAPVYVPVLLLALTVALHRMAIFWAPAALAPVWARAYTGGGGGEAIPGRPARVAAGAILLAGAAAGLALGGRSSLLLPLLPGPDRGYTLFSASHLSDYLNAQFLGSTAGFLLAGVALSGWLRRPGITAASWIALLAWAVPALGLFFFRPILGGADWDVVSLAAPFAFLFAATVLVDAAHRTRWLLLGVVLSAFNTIPWLVVQAGDASIARVRDLVGSDRADYFRGHPAPLHLAFVFAANGLPELQREELQRGEAQFPDDPRYPYNLAVLARARGDWDEAEREALAAFRIQQGYLPPLDVLYDAYKAKGATRDQVMVGRAIVEAYDTQREAVERYLPARRIAQIREEIKALGGLSLGDGQGR